jgi:predicted metalloendopeptidase
MVSTSLKIKKESKNKTNKIRNDKKNIKKEFTPKKLDIICNGKLNMFHSFEEKAEDLFKKNKIDIVSSSYNLEKQIVKELKKAINPYGVKANEDFYSYINDRWIKNYEVEESQKYIIQVDDFRLVQDKVYKELIELINNYLSNSENINNKKTENIKNAYISFKKWISHHYIREISNKYLHYIDEVTKDTSNIWILLAKINECELISWGAPFIWTINPDEKNPKIYKCYIGPPQLSILDTDVYFNDNEDNEDIKKYKIKYRNEFFKYLNNLFELCFGKNHSYNVKDIFDVEFDILNTMACNLIKEHDSDDYNLVSKDEALNNFGFNWEEFCKALGFKKVPNEFITSNINYLLCGTKLLVENWNSPKWKTYWIYIYIRQLARWNLKGWNDLFKFQGAFARGQQDYINNNIKPVFGMGYLFNTFLSNLYIEKYNDIPAINYVKSIAEDLRLVFIRIIKRNSWMQNITKKKALEKLYNFNLTVGSPKLMEEDPNLDYSPNDPWENLLKMSLWRHNKAINLVGKNVIDIPVIDWSEVPPKFNGSQAYVVNAYYTPSKNGIYIPLGYIQKPFIDLDERGIEYNLSRIGFTLAHEMSHALDDWGNKYNAFGVLDNWWTKKDQKEFNKIKADVIKQYEVYAAYDGIKFDAAPTVGEDMADISGIAICQEYLRDFQLKNQDILPIQSLSFTSFFVYFAVQSRQKITKKAISAQLKTNPHPLDKYRCNVPLSRSNIFRAIYNVKKGDKMWWHSANNIWSN